MSNETSRFLPSFLFNNPIYRNQNARSIFFAIGATYLAFKLFKVTKNLCIALIRFNKDLIARYGANSWAMITGASDGIGEAFALEFAKRGFNIILVGRNKEKLENVERIIKERHPLVQTRIVVQDFCVCYEQGWAEKIYEQVKDLDISILINNAGESGGGNYIEAPMDKLKSMVMVNCLSHALITRVILPKLTARSKRSAIINISSIAGNLPRPYTYLYSASKAFVDYFSRALNAEQPNMDILSVRPGMVSTKMTNHKSPDMKTVSTEDHVSAVLKALGTTDCTYGHWKHQWRGWNAEIVPKWLRKPYLDKVYGRK